MREREKGIMGQTEEKETLFDEQAKADKRKRKKGEPVFKRYEQNQMMLLLFCFRWKWNFSKLS